MAAPTGGRPVRALLVDGTVIRLRDLQEPDAALVDGFYRQLPLHDRFLRFFSAGRAARRPGSGPRRRTPRPP